MDDNFTSSLTEFETKDIKPSDINGYMNDGHKNKEWKVDIKSSDLADYTSDAQKSEEEKVAIV